MSNNFFRKFMSVFVNICLIWACVQAQSFEGVIKYVQLENTDMAMDTIYVYYGKNKIKTSRTEKYTTQLGGLSDEVVDYSVYPNTVTQFFRNTNEIKVFENKKNIINSTLSYPDSTKTILCFSCAKSDTFFEEHEIFNGKHKLVVSNWNTPCLQYHSSRDENLNDSDPNAFIPLMYTRTVFSKLVDGTDYFKSTTMIACEIIIKELSDDIFKIHRE